MRAAPGLAGGMAVNHTGDDPISASEPPLCG